MQIDFHHAVVYVIARLAEFDHGQANVIAYSSQYVDDATNGGTIKFDNGAMYTRVSSAHKILDYRNFSELESHHIWIPFHFLPGNGGMAAGENPGGSFIRKIVCRPDSPIARQMLEDCIAERNQPYGLHRLGVTMHVFADTWSHQQFAGVCNNINCINLLDEKDEPDASFCERLSNYFGDIFNKATSCFISNKFPLGHGAALSHPDLPFLSWRYRDSDGNTVPRNNTDLFTEAAHEMGKAMQRFQIGNAKADVPGLKSVVRDKIGRYLNDIDDHDGKDRHQKWLYLIAQGELGFPPVRLEYKEKGEGSWKFHALGTTENKDPKEEIYKYSPDFLSSDWKYFHDALMAHRFAVIHKILPAYGICVATD